MRDGLGTHADRATSISPLPLCSRGSRRRSPATRILRSPPGVSAARHWIPDDSGVRCRQHPPGKSGHSKAPWTIRQDHPGGKDPATGPTMQTSTANTQHDRGSPIPQIPPELLETVARALAAAVVPPPRQPVTSGTEQAADFLTPRRSRRGWASPARQSGGWPSPARCRIPWCAGVPGRRLAGSPGGSPTISRPAAWAQPTWPPSPPSGGRGSPRPHGDGPPAASPHPRYVSPGLGRLALPGCVPRRRPGGVLPRSRTVSRARTADLRVMPRPRAMPGLCPPPWDRARHLGWPDRTGPPRTAVPPREHLQAGAR